ncbi:MAG: DUF1440 domain-containing protein [Bacteroidetes bacterium]|nr:DUF1440 domain-containing protein [Bacteroidota bacterium]
MKTSFSFSKAAVAGIAGTVVMTMFTFMAPMMGIEMDIPKMLGSMFGGSLAIGWVMHFMIGIVLAEAYGFMFYEKIKISNPALRGAVFGIAPWLMAQLIVMPMTMMVMNGMSFSSGLFSGSAMMAMGSLVGHLIYGAVVGLVYKPLVNAVPAKI